MRNWLMLWILLSGTAAFAEAAGHGQFGRPWVMWSADLYLGSVTLPSNNWLMVYGNSESRSHPFPWVWRLPHYLRPFTAALRKFYSQIRLNKVFSKKIIFGVWSFTALTKGMGGKWRLSGPDPVRASVLCAAGLGFQKRQCNENYPSRDKLASNFFGGGGRISDFRAGLEVMHALIYWALLPNSHLDLWQALLIVYPLLILCFLVTEPRFYLGQQYARLKVLSSLHFLVVRVMLSTCSGQRVINRILRRKLPFFWYKEHTQLACPLSLTFLLPASWHMQYPGREQPSPDPEDKSHRQRMVWWEGRRKLNWGVSPKFSTLGFRLM